MDTSIQPATRILDTLFHLSQLISTFSKKMETNAGLTWHQLMTIRVIAETAPRTVTELSSTMLLQPASTGALLDRLESRGFVKRLRNGEDRRVVHIELTDKGRDISSRLSEIVRTALGADFSSPPLARLEEMACCLDILETQAAETQMTSQ